MSGIGKLLVFVNVFFSVGLMAWALSAYTNRVDWVDRQTAEGKVNGQITELKAEIDRLNKAVADAQSGYATKRYLLANSEDRVISRKTVFDQRLEAARNGKFKIQKTLDKGPFGEGVMYDTAEEGGDILAPDNKPLRGLKTLQDEFLAESKLIEQAMQGTQKLTEDQWQQIASGQITLEQVSQQLKFLGYSDLRRLHLVLSDLVARDELAITKQDQIRINLADEAIQLAERRINTQAALETLQRREAQLLQRLAQSSRPAR